MGEVYQPPQVETVAIESLPSLKADYVRLVHLTHPRMVEAIRKGGLDYSKYGMVASTARYWEDASQCQYWTDDPRFSYPGAVAVVMDVPIAEIRVHDSVRNSPGVVPAEYFVGVVEAKNPNPYA